MAGADGYKGGEARREQLLWVLSAATFFIFFQAYMVAPLIPRLSDFFGVSGQAIGLIVPAYMIPYGVSTLFYGLLSDRLGRRPICSLRPWPSLCSPPSRRRHSPPRR